MSHNCRPGYDWEGADGPIFESGGFGAAVEECHSTSGGQFWVGNSEYSTRVNYCPFCGAKAPKQVDWRPEMIIAEVKEGDELPTEEAAFVMAADQMNADFRDAEASLVKRIGAAILAGVQADIRFCKRLEDLYEIANADPG